MKTCNARWMLGLLLGITAARAETLQPALDGVAERPWIGPDFWANPMEDWHLHEGRAVNTHSGGDRELVLLSGEITGDEGDLEISANFHPEEVKPSAKAFIGFQLGLQGSFGDYRDSAIYGTGFAAGVTGDGCLFIGGLKSEPNSFNPASGVTALKLTATPDGEDRYQLHLTAASGDRSFTWSNPGVHSSWLRGLVSFTVSSNAAAKTLVKDPRPDSVPAINQSRGASWCFGISGIKCGGGKVKSFPERRFGPILWAQHTLESTGNLNLTAQFMPLDGKAPAVLTIDGKPVATSVVDPRSRVATFRISGVDTTKDHSYAIECAGAKFPGKVGREPADREKLVVAALSCNDATGFPHSSLVENVASHKPDIIAFMGDQIYEGVGGYGNLVGADNTQYEDRTTLCYLRKYYMHGWTWRDLLRDIPSITLPDDHDVFHGNIWGAGGKLADRKPGAGATTQDSGGYKLTVETVNAIHQTQTGNLPKPVDPAPCESGISVYFTRWHYAGVDIAILADRQFKSAPAAMLPESDVVNGWPRNHDKQTPALKTPRELDVAGASLLGDRQMKFLNAWADSPVANEPFRLVVSQTPLMCMQTIPEAEYSDSVVPSLKRLRPGEYPPNDIPKIDYDSNAWPQSGRDSAVEAITRAGAVHVTGDQHLGSTGQYGVKNFNDGAWWISSPAIANVWPRRWFPRGGGANRLEGAPLYTGDFQDAFGNRITVHAASNPQDIAREPSQLFDKAVGYSILTLNRKNGHITLANWPYWASPARSTPDDQPYPGWPVTMDPKSGKRVAP